MFVPVVSFLVIQACLLVFSPRLRHVAVFGWYYKNLYHPFFSDSMRYRWKYWLVPLFYAGIFAYCVQLFYLRLYSSVEARLLAIEKVSIPILLAWTLISGTLSVFVPPMHVNSAPRYASDHIIFHPANVCQSCRVTKLPRSKHCSICDICIPLHDHHCIWINNCVGYGNYQHFYSFLLGNCVLLTFASLRLLSIYDSTLSKDRVYLSLLLLTTAFGVISLVFSYYQLKLVQEGMTNNEQDKWFMVQEYMRDGNLVKDENGKLYFRVGPKPGNTEDDESFTTLGNTEKFYSTNPYDHTEYQLFNPITVHSHHEIDNIYDRGSLRLNFLERISWI